MKEKSLLPYCLTASARGAALKAIAAPLFRRHMGGAQSRQRLGEGRILLGRQAPDRRFDEISGQPDAAIGHDRAGEALEAGLIFAVGVARQGAGLARIDEAQIMDQGIGPAFVLALSKAGWPRRHHRCRDGRPGFALVQKAALLSAAQTCQDEGLAVFQPHSHPNPFNSFLESIGGSDTTKPP